MSAETVQEAIALAIYSTIRFLFGLLIDLFLINLAGLVFGMTMIIGYLYVAPDADRQPPQAEGQELEAYTTFEAASYPNGAYDSVAADDVEDLGEESSMRRPSHPRLARALSNRSVP